MEINVAIIVFFDVLLSLFFTLCYCLYILLKKEIKENKKNTRQEKTKNKKNEIEKKETLKEFEEELKNTKLFEEEIE